MTPPPGFSVRTAVVGDAPILARHRAEMFKAMGQLDPAVYGPLRAESEEYFLGAIPVGEYVGWVATPDDDGRTVIAGAGVQIRPILPRPSKDGKRLLQGRQGLVLNVFTDVEWRRRGVAERLMELVLAWAHDHKMANLVLHASHAGRPLYEKLGFAATNEMLREMRKS
jgi:GNAT superfamily N-acetyltransferase